MRGEIYRYVQECPECQLCQKNTGARVSGKIEPMGDAWEMVGMDLITKLLRSRGQDSILTIVDYHMGTVRTTACKEASTAGEIWQRAWEAAWRIIGIPRILITDRGAVFTSR